MTRTFGVDMSTSPASTGLVQLTWHEGGRAKVHEVARPKRSAIVELIRGSLSNEWWAVDVPFGWPHDFRDWLQSHGRGPAPEVGDIDGPNWSRLARRHTDRHVHAFNGTPGAGFSVSFDKLGATAAAWSSVESALAAGDPPILIDRSGVYNDSPREHAGVLETWPSAAWRAFCDNSELEFSNPAKMTPTEFRSVLEGVVELTPGHLCMSTSETGAHYRDALVCALVARARSLGGTELPSADLAEIAESEGWVHLPTVGLSALNGVAPPGRI